MKVKELIDLLQKYDADKDVSVIGEEAMFDIGYKKGYEAGLKDGETKACSDGELRAAYEQGREEGRKKAIEDCINRFDRYGSVWIQYFDDPKFTKETFATYIVTEAKLTVIDILNEMREGKA